MPVPNLAATLSLKSTPVEPPTEVIPVRFDPSIAGNAPVSLDAVKAEIRASATVPVKLAAGIEVRFAAEVAGKVVGNLPSGIVPCVKLDAFNDVKSTVAKLSTPLPFVLKN